MVHEGNTIPEREAVARRVALRKAIEVICVDFEKEFISLYKLKTKIHPLFKVTVDGEGNITTSFPSIGYWRAVNDSNTCDICSKYNNTVWVIDEKGEVDLRLILPGSTDEDHLKLHQQFHRNGKCRCKIEDISEDVDNQFYTYYTRKEYLIDKFTNDEFEKRKLNTSNIQLG